MLGAIYFPVSANGSKEGLPAQKPAAQKTYKILFPQLAKAAYFFLLFSSRAFNLFASFFGASSANTKQARHRKKKLLEKKFSPRVKKKKKKKIGSKVFYESGCSNHLSPGNRSSIKRCFACIFLFFIRFYCKCDN